jgi:hypothetical protein
MRPVSVLFVVCLLLLATSLARAQEPSQPIRMMQPPPPLQWPTLPRPAFQFSSVERSQLTTNNVRQLRTYPYAVESSYFRYVGGYYQDGTSMPGYYRWQRRW